MSCREWRTLLHWHHGTLRKSNWWRGRRDSATRSLCDREAYSHQCKASKTLLSASRRQYYSDLVTENQSNLRSLFSIFSKLLHRRSEAKYPKGAVTLGNFSCNLSRNFVETQVARCDTCCLNRVTLGNVSCNLSRFDDHVKGTFSLAGAANRCYTSCREGVTLRNVGKIPCNVARRVA